jgi:2-C-methyl-D-erythritol 4-phosphate cytidylyltransferase
VGEIVVVAPAAHVDEVRALVPSALVVAGGATRQDSVRAGLSALSADVDVVLVHDAARALAPSTLAARVVAAVREGHAAVVPGLAVTDTIKSVSESGAVVSTIDRSALRAIQTPQGFSRDLLERAHASSPGSPATDDAGLVEALGEPVHVVDGDRLALKVTTIDDLLVATALMGQS